MKAGYLFLVVSVAANVVLAAVMTRSKPAPVPAVPGTVSAKKTQRQSSITEGDPAKSTTSVEPAPAQDAPATGFSWAHLESADYQEYIARLRAFGVPERIVRDIIMADVQKLYRPRLAALRPAKKPENPNFWEQRFGGYNPYAEMTPEQREQQRLLHKEQTELIKTLLGENVQKEIAKESGYPDWTERMMGSIPEGMRDKITEMNEKYQSARSEIYAKTQGMIDQDTQADLKALQRKFRDELAAVLTPEQLLNYELRSSDVANNMRYQLIGFEPNEDEFRAVFAYKQAMEEFSPSRGYDPDAPRPTAEEMKARSDKMRELEAALSQSLGADRVKEYKMMEDYSYRSLYEGGIPRETIFKVADMKQQVEDATRRIQRDQSITPEKRQEALLAIQKETQDTLNTMLGERRAKSYVNQGGYWLRSIATPRVMPSP